MHIFILLLNIFQTYQACSFYEAVEVSDECLLENSSEINSRSKTECILYCQRKREKAVMKDGDCYCVDEATCQLSTNKTRHPTTTYFKKVALDCWDLVTSEPICYGAKDDSPAMFTVKKTGSVKSIKLQHISGFLKCGGRTNSYWGCLLRNEKLQTFITGGTTRATIFPVANHLFADVTIPGFDQLAAQLVLPAPNNLPYPVELGERFRIWKGEDLKNYYESDNSGTHCVKVYVLYE